MGKTANRKSSTKPRAVGARSDNTARKLRALEGRIRELESLISRREAKSREMPDPRLADVTRLTKRLFPGRVSIEVEADPALPDEPFVVFNVECAGTPAEIVRRRLEWHRELASLPASSAQFRLSIAPA